MRKGIKRENEKKIKVYGFEILNQRTKTHTYPQSHNPTTSSGKNPFFNEHDHHFCRVVADNDDPIDTSKLNVGIIFCDDNNDGGDGVDEPYEILAPSFHPDENDILEFNEVSGDNLEMEVKALQKLSLSTNQGNNDKQWEGGEEEKSPAKIVCPSEIIIDPHKFSITEKEYNNNDYDELDIDLETGLEEEFKEDPPSPTSPRDSEKEAPVFTEEEDGTLEAASYRFETDSNWQDESNIEFGDDPDYKIWSDDEGIDPLENK
nr:11724_t:CDS:2 [Entrophospora candida]